MPSGRVPSLPGASRRRLRAGIDNPSGGSACATGLSRREILRMGGVLGGGALLAACTAEPLRTSRPTPHDARVAIVGAGLAGLTAAYRLTQAGVPNVALYEARERVGGRCWTARGFADGQTGEHGGEFIDSRHVHLLGLIEELGLELDDLWEAWTEGSVWPSWIEGELVSRAEIDEWLAPISDAVEREARAIGVIRSGRRPSIAAMSHGTATEQARTLDAMSMAEWLDANVPEVIGTPAAAYLDMSMAGWYGLEMDRLSACTWVDYFVIPAPGADERWRVRGGNDQVATLLADALPEGVLRLGTPMEATRVVGDGSYELRFTGVVAPVRADIVILALPFTTLRQTDLTGSGFDAERRAAIDELGMGNSVKLLLQYGRRPPQFQVADRLWSGGMDHTGPHFQTWESSAGQSGASGLVTVYAGGHNGANWSATESHAPAPEGFAAEYVAMIDEVVPRTGAAFDGRSWLDLWTLDPWTQGAYSAYLPGQYTRFWGYSGQPEGNVHFAGEHTSTHSWGYLNGGVESGQRTAIGVLEALRIEAPRSIADLPYSGSR
jgi:monoamine oxidase